MTESTKTPTVLFDKSFFTNRYLERAAAPNEKDYLLGILDFLDEDSAVIAGGSVLTICTDKIQNKKNKIYDYDFYVTMEKAKKIMTYIIDKKLNASVRRLYNTPAYDDSFFKKNNIIGRILLGIHLERNSLAFDIIIINDEQKPLDVIRNFDLTFCETWFDGIDIKTNYPDDVRSKKGKLKNDYVKSLFDGNKFILDRMKKYKKRGFEIEIKCDKDNLIFDTKKKNKLELIQGDDLRSEEWIVSKIMKLFLSLSQSFLDIRRIDLDCFLQKNNKRNILTLFTIEPGNVQLANTDFELPLFTNDNKPSLYSRRCYTLYMACRNIVTPDNTRSNQHSQNFGKKNFTEQSDHFAIAKKNTTFYYDQLKKFLDTNLKEQYLHGKKLFENLIKMGIVSKRSIGQIRSPVENYGFSYSIPLSKEFVQLTQFKPLLSIDADTESQIKALSGNDEIHIIYACPDGHLHASNNCGIPTTISKCGFPLSNGTVCQHYVGGLYHMLVPGNYIVQHDGFRLGFVYYGNFPINSYKVYEKMYDQYVKACKNYEESQNDYVNYFLMIPEKMPNKDETLTAKPFKKPDGTNTMEKREDNNEFCFVCSDPLNENDTDEKQLYILPCGHLIHKECLANARGLQYNEFEDNNINDEVDTSGRICPYTTCNRQHFLFGTRRRRRSHMRRRSRSRSRRCSRRRSHAFGGIGGIFKRSGKVAAVARSGKVTPVAKSGKVAADARPPLVNKKWLETQEQLKKNALQEEITGLIVSSDGKIKKGSKRSKLKKEKIVPLASEIYVKRKAGLTRPDILLN